MSLLVTALFLSMILFVVDELYLLKFIYWIFTFIGVLGLMVRIIDDYLHFYSTVKINKNEVYNSKIFQQEVYI